MTAVVDRRREPAFIDAGNLLSFVPTLPFSQRGDVLDSDLLAQLVADGQYSRFEKTELWYHCYVTTLEQLAWRTTFDKPRRFVPAGTHFTAGAILLDALAVEADRRLVERSIAAFDEVSVEDRRFIVYRNFTYAPPTLVLQVGACLSDLALTTLTLTLQTSQPIERLFAERLSTKRLTGDIQLDTWAGELNLAIYAGIRKAVIEKLGTRREDDILDLHDA